MKLVHNWQARFIDKYNTTDAKIELIGYMLYYAIKSPDANTVSVMPDTDDLRDKKQALLAAIDSVHLANIDERSLIKVLAEFKAKFSIRYIDTNDEETNLLLNHSVRFNKPLVVSYLLSEFVKEGYKFQKSDPIITNALKTAFIFASSGTSISSLLAVSPESLTIEAAQFGINLGYPKNVLKKLYGSIQGVTKASKNLFEQSVNFMKQTSEGAKLKASQNREMKEVKVSKQLEENYYTHQADIYLASQASTPEESAKYLYDTFIRAVESITKYYKAHMRNPMLYDLVESCAQISISFDQINSKMLKGLISIYNALPSSRDILSEAIIKCYEKIDDQKFNSRPVIKWFFENHKKIEDDHLKLAFFTKIQAHDLDAHSIILADKQNIIDAYNAMLEKLKVSNPEDIVSGLAAPVLYYTASINDMEAGSKLLEKLYSKYPQLANHQNILFKLSELRIYSAINAPVNLEKVQAILSWMEKVKCSNAYDTKLVSQAHSIYLDTIIDAKNFDQAKSYLEDYKQYFTPIAYKLYNAILNGLWRLDAGEYEVAASVASDASGASAEKGKGELKSKSSVPGSILDRGAKQTAVKYLSPERIATIEESLNGDDLSEITQGELNFYYQYIKKRSAAEVTQKSTVESWRVKDKVYKSSDENVKKIGEGWYCTIDQKIEKSLDPTILEKVESAISHGIGPGIRQIGVVIMNGIAKIKITEDTRIYANCVYDNENGTHVIIFNKQGTHDHVEKLSFDKTLVFKHINVAGGATDDSGSGDEEFFGGYDVGAAPAAAAAAPAAAAHAPADVSLGVEGACGYDLDY